MQLKRPASSCSQWYQNPLGATPRELTFLSIRLIYAESGEPTSGLEPLTCSLRVIGHVLRGFAQECKSRISRRLSLLRVAQCCTVLRSRWYQSGIKRLPLMHSRSLCQTSAPSILSASSACEGPPHPWIATMFYPEGVNGRKRKGRGHSKPRPVSVLYPTGG
jgi:hypothetical protein